MLPISRACKASTERRVSVGCKVANENHTAITINIIPESAQIIMLTRVCGGGEGAAFETVQFKLLVYESISRARAVEQRRLMIGDRCSASTSNCQLVSSSFWFP